MWKVTPPGATRAVSAAGYVLLPFVPLPFVPPNRGNGRRRIFFTPLDYLAFFKALAEACVAVPGVRVLAWCVMPNHWHLVLWPTRDGELSAFVRRLTQTHAQRHRRAHDRVGYGSLYQGRYKSFPVQGDGAHLLVLCRYVERNALRARLVRRAADWRWGSAWARARGDEALRALLSNWPVDRPRNWEEILDEPQPDAQEQRVHLSLTRGRPLGDDKWTARAAARMGLTFTLRPVGRPPKHRPKPASAGGPPARPPRRPTEQPRPPRPHGMMTP